MRNTGRKLALSGRLFGLARRSGAAAAIASVMALSVAPMTVAAAPVATLTFSAITSNNDGDVQIGQNQLSIEVSCITGGTQVQFLLKNAGPENAVVTQVVFDDASGLLNQIVSLTGGTGDVVNFVAEAPNNFGGGQLQFSVTAGADAVNPSPTHGVGPGEELSIVFSLNALPGGQTCEQAIGAALASNSLATNLRIGIHVQSFDSEGSEKFVAPGQPGTPTDTPELGSVALFGSGALGMAGYALMRVRAQRRRQ